MRRFLDLGELEKGFRLPSVREFQEISGLRHYHVSRALDILASEGRIVKRRGSGTFVAGGSDNGNGHAKETLRIGVIPPVWDPGFSHHVIALVLKGITEQVGLRHHMHLVPGDIAETQPVEFVSHIHSLDLDGLIWVKPPVAPPPALVRIFDSGLPVVLVGRAYPGLPMKGVHDDYKAMGNALAEYLVAKRRHKLLCMVGVRNDVYTQDYVRSVRNALSARDIPLPDDQIVTVRLESVAKTYSIDLRDNVLPFLARHPDFDAVFSMYSDQLGALAYLHENNIRRCPEDFIHIHNGQLNVWGGQTWPPFPSAFLNSPGMNSGRQAVKELERLLGVEGDLTDEDSAPRIIHDPYV